MAVLKIEGITQEKIEELFTIFRMVNRSHWKTPTIALVNMQLKKERYTFKVGLGDKWTQKFVLEKKDGKIEVKMEINEAQPKHILEGLKKIKSYFDQEIVKHG